jgi:uncharacterized membrane protein
MKGKTIAIVSYITIIGWVIALVLNQDKKDKFASFHIRQSLLLIIAAAVLGWIPVLGWILAIVIFVFWIIGLISAVQGTKKEVPVLGPLAQKWFASL